MFGSLPDFEVPASGWLCIHQARSAVVGDEIGVDEFVIDHEFNLIIFECSVLEGHHSIANQNSFEVDRFSLL